MKRPRLGLGVAFVLMALPLLLAVFTSAARPASRQPWLAPAKPGTTCVLPKLRMRREHMRYLLDLRDEVVRAGRRATGAASSGLGACRGCHANREQFCDRCHARASVRLDCFECHGY
jgi:hypothetical protein